jgi:hypothetical protein
MVYHHLQQQVVMNCIKMHTFVAYLFISFVIVKEKKTRIFSIETELTLKILTK